MMNDVDSEQRKARCNKIEILTKEDGTADNLSMDHVFPASDLNDTEQNDGTPRERHKRLHESYEIDVKIGRKLQNHRMASRGNEEKENSMESKHESKIQEWSDKTRVNVVNEDQNAQDVQRIVDRIVH